VLIQKKKFSCFVKCFFFLLSLWWQEGGGFTGNCSSDSGVASVSHIPAEGATNQPG